MSTDTTDGLPIQEILQALATALLSNNAIVVAPPGAGKSTFLPLFLLRQPAYQHSKIIMLQPRRIAARNIALYLSQQLGESVGNTVGYRVRGDVKVSTNTRLEIVTEGILTRMLQSSPELEGVDLIIFDEFHERSVHADLSLALSLEVQQALRDDLRLLVMSATLATDDLSRIMPKADVLTSTGRSYPVDIKYITKNKNIASGNQHNIIDQVSRLIIDIVDNHHYDILVFLPGVYEIRIVAEQLSSRLSDFAILPLFSDLNKDQQRAALSADANGKRKIVLATNIAETSLTIDGIEVVVDSGIEKKAIFDLRRGVTHLTSQKISQASATQRAGRAGRLMAGTCYRLWSNEQQQRLAKQSIPEILHTDARNIVLESALWGAQIQDLALIDQPSSAHIEQASQKLNLLGIFDEQGRLTELGRKVYQLGADANISIMLIKSQQLSQSHQSLACVIAALLESKDPLTQSNTSELTPRLLYLQKSPQHPIWRLVKQWHRKLKISSVAYSNWPIDDVALLLAFAYPDWIGRHTSNGRFGLTNGSGAILQPSDDLLTHVQHSTQSNNQEAWLSIANMQLSGTNTQDPIIRYAQPISYAVLCAHFPNLLSVSDSIEWDANKQKITAFKASYFGRVLVSKKTLAISANLDLSGLWATVIRQKGLSSFNLGTRAKQFLLRVQIACKLGDSEMYPDCSSEGLMRDIEHWLLPYLTDITSWQQLMKLPFYQLLSQRLDYQQLKRLEQQLPENMKIPTGRQAGLIYTDSGKALLSVRMQEVYGLQQHPTLLNGRLPITCELLSPAQRPLQTTSDIVGFWQGSYREIQKEMKGRYPRHFWPDDPASAPATSTTKKKM